MQEKIHLQRFPIQNGLFQGVVFVGELEGEKRPVLVDESKEDLVAFPHGESEEVLFLYPFEVALVAFDLVARPVSADEDVHVLIVVDVVHKGDDAAVAPLRDGETCLLPHLAQHAVLGAFAFLELAAYAEPFVVVEVVLFLGAVQHEILRAAFQIA